MKYTLNDSDVVSFRYRKETVRFALPDRNDCIQKNLRSRKTFADEWMWNRVLKYTPANPTVVDVGAHIGSITVWFAKVAGAKNVVAIEPDEYIGSILDVNINLNGLSDIVTVVHGAVSDSLGKAKMEFSYTGNSGASMYRKCDDSAGTVQCTSLDSLRANGVIGDVDVLKIDVEGYQIPVLQGSKELISSCRPVIVTELWKPGIRVIDPEYDTADVFVRMIDMMSDLGYVMSEQLDQDNYIFEYKG